MSIDHPERREAAPRMQRIKRLEAPLHGPGIRFQVGAFVFKVIPAEGYGIHMPAEGPQLFEDVDATAQNLARLQIRLPLSEPYDQVTRLAPEKRGIVIAPGLKVQFGRPSYSNPIRGVDWVNPDGSISEGQFGGTLVDSPLGIAMRHEGGLSRQHATLEAVDANTVVLQDLGSRNGTYLL